MMLLKNGLRLFILVSSLVILIVSGCKEKHAAPEIIFKIPDPLRVGIKINLVNHAIITEYRTAKDGKLNKWDFTKSAGYDSFGNINSYWFDKFIYDSNGFKIARYYDGCYKSKEAYFYQKTNQLELTLKGYYLKDYKLHSPIDTNYSSTKFTGEVFQFYPNGYLKKIKYKSRTNTSYLYDSLNRLATIIDSLDRNGDDYDLPVRKEFLYNNKGKLSKVNELNRSNLLSTANVNLKGLIDTVFYFNKLRKVEKLEVYEYK